MVGRLTTMTAAAPPSARCTQAVDAIAAADLPPRRRLAVNLRSSGPVTLEE